MVIAHYLAGALLVASIGMALQVVYLQLGWRDRREVIADTASELALLQAAGDPDKVEARRAAGRRSLEFVTARIRSSGALACVHLLVASTTVVHLATHTPLLPVWADYYAAVVRIFISLFVIAATAFNLHARHRALR